MKRYFLLGLTALGLVALTPTESKADDGLRVYLNPGYQQDRPYYDGDSEDELHKGTVGEVGTKVVQVEEKDGERWYEIEGLTIIEVRQPSTR
jgi:hypothetical protein